MLGPPAVEAYSPHGRPIRPKKRAAPNRAARGKALSQSLEDAVVEAAQRRTDAGFTVHGAAPGLYVQFESEPDVPLDLKSLESTKQGIELVAASHSLTEDSPPKRIERATVFVPEGRVKHFLERFEAYAKTTPKAQNERRYEKMLDPVAGLQLATLRSLWTDSAEAYPDPGANVWWEVWLRRHDGKELERLYEFALHENLTLTPRRLQFDDRIVALVRASATQLSASIDVLNDIAELRLAKEVATPFVRMGGIEQGEWVGDLLRRTTATAADSPVVCVLDTGVNRGHPLLEASLAAVDCHAYDSEWRTNDHHGHGTEMAGLALYGDLTPVLSSSQPVSLRHSLESVKILPLKGNNPPELYGAIMASATSRVEIEAPLRQRCFSMAIAATDQRDRGQPTSWSAAIDALACGRGFDPDESGLVYIGEEADPVRRLFLLSAGNVEELQTDHMSRSDVDPVHDPGQAWNALTIGGYTDKAIVTDTAWSNWQPVARPGDLSPWSTTGVTFADAWPLKPDVVFEAGNVVKNAVDELDGKCPDVRLLTTYFAPKHMTLVATEGTSPATAQAARFAAQIMTEYPALRPESVRGLVVHSAEWTAPMRAALKDANGKRARGRLVRRYGFGVPSLPRALRSANDALTLLVEGSIRPYSKGKMREMHLFDLPWPRDVLTSLGEATVKVRVTLSYFVEPNPARRGWKWRYRYASHGLRFEVKGPTESGDDFHKRLNQKALDEEEEKPSKSNDSNEWYLGEQVRNHGSIHSDVLTGTAADIAERGVIAVYPVSGWWKDQPKRDRSELGAKYSLIVSIETPGTEADIWTPVANLVGVPVDIDIPS